MRAQNIKVVAIKGTEGTAEKFKRYDEEIKAAGEHLLNAFSQVEGSREAFEAGLDEKSLPVATPTSVKEKLR